MTTVTAAEVQTRPRKHRLLNRAQLLVYKLFFAHLGKFIVVAAYFILLETLKGQHTTVLNQSVTLPDVKGTWDQLLSRTTAQGGLLRLISQSSWDSMRHIVFRGVLEGVLGIVLFNQIGFKVDKYRAKLDKEPNGVDRLVLRSRVFASPYQDRPVTPVQYLFLPVLLVLVTILVGVPIYLGVHAGLAHAAHWTWLEPQISTHASIWAKIYGGEYDGLIVGLVTGVVANRTYRAYLYANTMNYGRSWVASDRGPKWWMPWPTRSLIRELQAEGVAHQQSVLAERHSAMRWLAPLGVALALGAAVFGYLVLQTNGFTQ